MEEDKQLQNFVSLMPKVELHAHLNGCIREDTIFQLAKQGNVTLSSTHFGHQQQCQKELDGKPLSSTEGENSYSHMYNVRPRSLQDCFEMFAEIPKVVDDAGALTRITREALEDFARHHVVYLELRSTPKRMKRDGLTKKEYIQTILKVMKEFEQEQEERYQSAILENNNESNVATPIRMPMKSRFIVSIDRSGSVEEAEENVALAISFFQEPNSLVVGVDIGGNPTRNDFRDFQGSIARARHAGLKVTVHCAEVPVGGDSSEENPKLQKSFEEVMAVLDFRPDRLGHALLLPPSLRDLLINEYVIPVETCPTSNVMTLELAKHMGGNLIHGLQQHPQLKQWLQCGYPLSIGTDDPGVFHTNATQELLLLARAWEVPEEQLQHIVVTSMDQAFCSHELRDSIKRSMEEFFTVMKARK